MEVIIRLSDNGQIMVEGTGPVKTSKYISPESLASILMSSHDIENTYETPMPLPQNCIYYKRKNDKELFILEKPAHRREVTYYGTKFTDVGFPKLLFGYIIDCKTTTIEKTILVAVKNDIFIKPDTEIFKYPFSNVYASGNCCWGTCVVPKIDHPYQLSSLPELYLFQEDNGDLYEGVNASGLQYRELLGELQGKDFNLEWLVPFHAKTFLLFIENIF